VSKAPSSESIPSMISMLASLTPRRRHTRWRGGNVNGNNLTVSLLELEGSPARPTADIQDAALNEEHGLLLDARPLDVGSEVVGRPTGHDDEPVVALDDLLAAAALEVIEYGLADRILVRPIRVSRWPMLAGTLIPTATRDGRIANLLHLVGSRVNHPSPWASMSSKATCSRRASEMLDATVAVGYLWFCCFLPLSAATSASSDRTR